MKTLKEKIEVMQAALDGKEIEWRTLFEGKWSRGVDPEYFVFDWYKNDYRIKKVPLVLYVNVYDNNELIPYSTLNRANANLNSHTKKGSTIMMREVVSNEEHKED